jgi:hypothetical protein
MLPSKADLDQAEQEMTAPVKPITIEADVHYTRRLTRHCLVDGMGDVLHETKRLPDLMQVAYNHGHRNLRIISQTTTIYCTITAITEHRS